MPCFEPQNMQLFSQANKKSDSSNRIRFFILYCSYLLQKGIFLYIHRAVYSCLILQLTDYNHLILIKHNYQCLQLYLLYNKLYIYADTLLNIILSIPSAIVDSKCFL